MLRALSGIRILYGASVKDIHLEDARCIRWTSRPTDAANGFRRKALIVASGGLEANHEWLEQRWGAGARNFVVRGTPDNDGELLLKLLEAGAAPAGSDLFHCIAVDARSPNSTAGSSRVSIPFRSA